MARVRLGQIGHRARGRRRIGYSVWRWARRPCACALRRATSAMATFLEALASGPLVFDGAMGTQLYERGVLYSACFEELNVSQPELVRKVHEDYVRAGAQVIETNTFGANALRLEKHGLAAKRGAS